VNEDARHAVVIGAAGGIGSRVADLLCGRGIRVVGVDVSDPPAVQPGGYTHLNLDAATPEAVEAAFTAIASLPVRYIINVAGGATKDEVNQPDAFAFSNDVMRQTLDSNFSTSLTSIELAARLAAASPHRDMSLVLCSSINAIGNYDYPSYSAAKGAIESLLHSQCLPLGKLGVRINCVRLGTVVTQMARSLHGDESSTHFEHLLALTALGRFVTVDEAASSLVVVAVDLAGMTGAIIPVDAGQSVPGTRL
jgi:3-oxoacyl-[acyl-carrier protein] reductase